MFTYQGYLYRKALMKLHLNDKRTLSFFEEKDALDGKLLKSDGVQLTDTSGNVLAEWKGKKLYINSGTSQLAQAVEEWLRRNMEDRELGN